MQPWAASTLSGVMLLGGALAVGAVIGPLNPRVPGNQFWLLFPPLWGVTAVTLGVVAGWRAGRAAPAHAALAAMIVWGLTAAGVTLMMTVGGDASPFGSILPPAPIANLVALTIALAIAWGVLVSVSIGSALLVSVLKRK